MKFLFRTLLGATCLISVVAFADAPRWCGEGNYSPSHPLAWERFEDSVDALVREKRIRDAYSLVVKALEDQLSAEPPSEQAAVVEEALEQYLDFILAEPGREAGSIFVASLSPPRPGVSMRMLQYHLGPLGEGAPTRFHVVIPCPSLAAGEDPALRNVAHALWSMHRVSQHRDFGTAVRLAAQRSSQLYRTYEDYVTKGLPMWPWELWANGSLVPDDFNEPAPSRQWVFLRPNVSPALVTGSESNAELDYGLTLEIGHVWYRNEDYSAWWGLSAMVALSDDEGVGYGGLFRWNDYGLGVARHGGNDETLVYVNVDLYRFVTGEDARVNSTRGFLDAVLEKAANAAGRQ